MFTYGFSLLIIALLVLQHTLLILLEVASHSGHSGREWPHHVCLMHFARIVPCLELTSRVVWWILRALNYRSYMANICTRVLSGF